MTNAIGRSLRLTPTHRLILISIALLVIGAVGLVHMRQRGQAQGVPAAATATGGARSATLKPPGRERCMRKCAVIHKGYVYRAEQQPQRAGSANVEPEFCACI
jgi:hypothetical protein